jgi:hypothetical protein
MSLLLSGIHLPATTPGQVPVASGSSWIAASISGHATLAENGNLTLADSGVVAGNYKFVSATVDRYGRVTAVASQAPSLDDLSDVEATTKTAGNFIVADIASVAANGSVTLAASAITSTKIADGAVTNAKLTPMPRGSIKVGSNAGVATDLPMGSAGQVLLSNGTDSSFVTLSGVVAVSNSGVKSLSNKTENYTIVAADSGTILTNKGAAATVVTTLPAQSPGLVIKLVVAADPGTQTITSVGGATTHAGTSITFNKKGGMLELVAISNTEWYISNAIGAWVLS